MRRPGEGEAVESRKRWELTLVQESRMYIYLQASTQAGPGRPSTMDGDHKIPQLYYTRGVSETLRDYYKGPYLLVLGESSP